VSFEDGNVSDYSQEQVDEFQTVAKKGIGEIGCFYQEVWRGRMMHWRGYQYSRQWQEDVRVQQ